MSVLGSETHPDQGDLHGRRILCRSTTWDEIGHAWLDSTDLPSTRDTYERGIREYFAWCEKRGVNALAPGRPALDSYKQRLLRLHPKGRTTVARKLSTVSSLLTYGRSEFGDLVPDNPMRRVKRPKVAKESTRSSVELGEIQRMLASARQAGGRDAAVVALLAWTGIRVAELRGAMVGDMATERGERVVTVSRKGGKRQTVTISEPATAALDSYLDGRRDGPLVLGVRGGPISRHEVATIVERHAKTSGVDKRVTPHSMRHTFATLAFDADADPREVQRMMGHESIETTMRYNHSRGRVDRSPAHALVRLLGSA